MIVKITNVVPDKKKEKLSNYNNTTDDLHIFFGR